MTTDLDYHKRQYQTRYASTDAMLAFIEEIAGPLPAACRVLDVACGAGANCHHMLERWPARFTGVDLDEELIAHARALRAPAHAGRVDYEVGDLFTLPGRHGRSFDVTTFYQSLMLFSPDDYPAVLAALAGCTRGWLFLSSLFSDKRMDVSCLIRDYARFGEDSRREILYSILDIGRFRRVAAGLGARQVVLREFQIPIDLAGPPGGGLGTFTVRRDDGRRLQFSGAVPMPWYLAALRFDGDGEASGA
jgi:SAM-dependent methyltransferase